MSILNDKEITQLSIMPKWVIEKRVTPTEFSNGTSPYIVKSYSHDSEEEVAIECINTPKATYRSLTLDEQQAFVPMIENFIPKQIRTNEVVKLISYGLSSMGFDVRLAEDFRIFSNTNALQVDPKNFDENCLVEGKLNTAEDGSKYVIIPPNSYLLGHTIERFNIPKDIMVVALGKSTYARAGAIVNVTPIEPGFSGTVVIEVSNSTPLPLRVYANEGISQFLFFKSSGPCDVSYSDRDGKYMNQTGMQLPIT